jgi:hypothetical protein
MTIALLDAALATISLTFEDLLRSASEVILFGSRAAGLDRQTSDWDVLCIGAGKPRATQHIDLLWLSPSEQTRPEWLSSELAGHVAQWGQWLHGSPDWIEHVRPGNHAVAQKSRRIAARAAALARTWHALTLAHQHKHLSLLRRDLQRHLLLQRRAPVPPNVLLDADFRNGDAPEHSRELLQLARRLGVTPRLVEHLSRASAHAPSFPAADCPSPNV